MQKACGHTLRCYHTLLAQGFRFFFTPRTGVLFTFPSRYCFAIGHRCVFSLGGWAPRIQTEFHVFRSTWDSAGRRQDFAHGPITLSGAPFQVSCAILQLIPCRGPATPAPRRWFGLLPVRSPLLGESLLFSFPPGTEMFHFSGCRSLHPMYSDAGSLVVSQTGFPHSDISGSMPICGSPKLFAAYHVLLRHSMPRHSPCALSNLTKGQSKIFNLDVFVYPIYAIFKERWFLEALRAS